MTHQHSLKSVEQKSWDGLSHEDTWTELRASIQQLPGGMGRADSETYIMASTFFFRNTPSVGPVQHHADQSAFTKEHQSWQLRQHLPHLLNDCWCQKSEVVWLAKSKHMVYLFIWISHGSREGQIHRSGHWADTTVDISKRSPSPEQYTMIYLSWVLW